MIFLSMIRIMCFFSSKINFLTAVILSIYISFVFGEDNKIRFEEQPGCHPCHYAEFFFKNHANASEHTYPIKNWICHQPYPKLLKYCFTVYILFTPAENVTSNYKVTRDENSVEKECKKRKLTFRNRDRMINETLEVRIFHCPITKMDIRFPEGANKPEKMSDFYIAQGCKDGTIAVLHDSEDSDNICVTHMYRPANTFDREKFK